MCLPPDDKCTRKDLGEKNIGRDTLLIILEKNHFFFSYKLLTTLSHDKAVGKELSDFIPKPHEIQLIISLRLVPILKLAWKVVITF